MKRSQFIATILAVACAGGVVSTSQACESRLQPVGELVTTRTFVRERPLHTTRIIERPAPIAERITTRRVTTTRTLAPVGERIVRRTYVAPVAERYAYERPSFTRTITAPVRFVGDVVSAPFRSYRTGPEIVGERVMVTRVTRPTVRKKVLRTTTTTLAPVGERVILCP